MSSDFEKLQELKSDMVGKCPDCAGSGYIGNDECKCLTKFSSYVKLHYNGVEKEYWDLTLDDLHIEPISKSKIKDFIDHIDNAKKHGLGMALSGGHGTGKTLSSVLILKAAIAKEYSVYFTTLAELLKLIKQTFDSSREDTEALKELYNSKIMGSDFLVIDDMGEEYTPRTFGSFCVAEMSMLMRHRRRNCLSTIITTNLSRDVLMDKYGSAISSLLKSNLEYITFAGKDYRETQGANFTDLLRGN